MGGDKVVESRLVERKTEGKGCSRVMVGSRNGNLPYNLHKGGDSDEAKLGKFRQCFW